MALRDQPSVARAVANNRLTRSKKTLDRQHPVRLSTDDYLEWDTFSAEHGWSLSEFFRIAAREYVKASQPALAPVHELTRAPLEDHA